MKNKTKATKPEKTKKSRVKKTSKTSPSTTRRSDSRRTSIRKLFLGLGLAAAIVLLVFLAVVNSSRSTLGSLINFAKSDKSLDDFRHSSSVAIISASTGESKAETFRASGDSLDQALSRLTKRVKAAPDYPNYRYFRLDVAPFSQNAARLIIENFPDISEHSYFIAHGSGAISMQDIKLGPKDMLAGASNYLAGQVQDNGKFIYGHYMDTGEEIEGYSIPRHAGTLTSMLNAYSVSRDSFLLSKITMALDYLKGFIVYDEKSGQRLALVADDDGERLTLVSTSLAALAFAGYANITGLDTYNDVLNALINGINSLKRLEPGKNKYESECLDQYIYNQELYLDFSQGSDIDNYSRWYDGQATYALVEASKALNDESLLDLASNNINAFIEGGYASDEHTHWTIYATASYLFERPDSDSRYYHLVTSAVSRLFPRLINISSSAPTRFESVTLAAMVISIAEEQNISLDLPDTLLAEINTSINKQLAAASLTYRPIHYAIFSHKPTEYANSFVVTSDKGRSRIDDNQHVINALYNYLVLID